MQRLTLLLLVIVMACHTTQKVRNGRMAYDLKKYALAAEMLSTELQDDYEAEKQLLLADALAKIDRIDQSIAAYEKAVDAETPSRYLIDYAQVLKRAERYDEAIDIYKMLMTEVALDALLSREIAQCEAGKEWKHNPDTLVDVIKLDFNSRASDYAASIIDGRLVFTSDRFSNEKEAVYDWTGKAFSNLWEYDINRSEAIPYQAFNTSDNEGSAVLSPDGKTIFFTRCLSFDREDAFCRLMYAKRERGRWSKPRILETVNGEFNVMHPAFSADGRLLFFASDRPGGLGEKDIYYTTREGDEWLSPRNLGQIVNTQGNEVFPFVYRDTLFFSSDGRDGMGGLDIFYTYFDDEGRWVRPINMRSPYNSGADDFAIVIDTLNQLAGTRYSGYFSSSRQGGEGQDDIYGFVHRHPPVRDTSAETPLLLSVKVVRPIYRAENDPGSGIRRFVPVEGAEVIINELKLTTDITGLIVEKMDSLETYRISASAEGFLSNSASYQYESGNKREGYVRLVLYPLLYDMEIVIDNIYYDFEKWDIRPDARPALDSLAVVLENNPGIRIELGSHTDCRGDDDFNLELSQKRANAAIAYLNEAGISKERLSAIGYGESRPKAVCRCVSCTEDEHQLNRRTTFRILRE